jgi:hypothetical protein
MPSQRGCCGWPMPRREWPSRCGRRGGGGGNWKGALTLALALLAAPAATGEARGGQGAAAGPGASAAPRHQVELLGLAVFPAGGELDEVYGNHFGIAGRYGLRLGARWGVAVEAGQRSASGSTPVLGAPAKIDVQHGAVSARFHLRPRSDSSWDAWVSAGVLHQRLEEEVRFPDATATAKDDATGPLVGLGARWPGRRGWGVSGELRYSRLRASRRPSGRPGADLDGFEAVAGVAYSW